MVSVNSNGPDAQAVLNLCCLHTYMYNIAADKKD